jgi:membrane protease YdiL (CAAX protease family)
MGQVHHQYVRLIQQFDLNTSDVIFISCCAGVGEEVLFRGAIQPFMGIIITAILFVAIHGYLNPRNWRISIYGVFMTAGIVLLGYLAETMGLLVAIVAHTIIDIYLLNRMIHRPMPIEITIQENLEDTSHEQEDERT